MRTIGACNTVLFGAPAIGFNTDYTGYVSAFRAQFGARPPGAVAMAGSGGVGKAVAFGLAKLGAKSLTLFDIDDGKSRFSHIKAQCPSESRRRSLTLAKARMVSSIARHREWWVTAAMPSAASPSTVGGGFSTPFIRRARQRS